MVTRIKVYKNGVLKYDHCLYGPRRFEQLAGEGISYTGIQYKFWLQACM